jgi:tetratricopeptide (TPR) repeat protein
MNLPLPSPRARAALIVGSGALALFLSYFGIRNALAAHSLGFDTREGYQQAVKLEPGDSRNWYFLGRSYLYDFEQPDAARAVQAFGKAVALDPYAAEAWLDLASGYEEEGDWAHAREAYRSALRAYPLSAEVNWGYGNFLLREGHQVQGFQVIRKAVELDPKRSAEAFSRALRVEPDANILLDQAVPASAAVYLPILQALSDAGDLENAQLVWDRLVALGEKVSMREMAKFFDALIRRGRTADAYRLWPQAVSIMLNLPPADPGGSLVWDGGFESGYTGAGFAWYFRPVTEDVQISLDRSEKRSGEQSLRILFNGLRNVNFEDGCHNIAPEPGKRYLLTAWVRTQSLTSSEGVRLEIVTYDPPSNERVQTEAVDGTQVWKQIRMEWVAPATATIGMVCVKRNMSDMPGSNIQGAAWIDDVSLVPIAEAPAKP